MSPPTDSTAGYADDGSNGATLGAMLRKAREQRNLSVPDLAACVRLEPKIIERLESNKFDQLPAPAFIRGYVRSIAKQLEIDSSPLISVFNLRAGDDPPGLRDFESRAPVEITSDSSVIRYTTVALCAVMVLMTALWWQSHDLSLPSFGETDGTPATNPPAAVPATEPLTYDFPQVAHSDDPFYRAEAVEFPSAGEATAGTGEQSLPDGAAQAATLAPPSADIVISTREDAWIAISDGQGRRLHYSIAKPGNEILIDGEKPYSVVIGNAPAVSVTFEGQPFDILRFAREGIARFELGRDPD